MSTISFWKRRRGAGPWRSLLLLVGLAIALTGCAARQTTAPVPAAALPLSEEIRALWVDAFHAGIRTGAEAEQLVADAKGANFNTLIVQVRRRGDALYTKSFEPPLDDPAYDPAFDALDSIIEVAHREGLEVHAWVNAMPVWRDATPPKDPRHVFNQHGPGKTGEEHWLTLSPKGEDRFPVGYFLDPGHPGAAAHVAEVYLNIVRHYKVDGIHFDYIRYPETEERMPRGSGVGYNATALARFRAATGRTDTPLPGDEQFTVWRRHQVTQLVRRVYIEAKAINPRIKVSAATIAWGKPPTNEKTFLDASPGQRIFQDWHGLMKEGLLDIAFPMNYARESDLTVRGWFDGWIAWGKKHKHGRQLAVGIGAYLNPPKSILAQVSRVRAAQGKHRADGMSFFSYASPAARPTPGAAQSAPAPAPAVPPLPVSFLREGILGAGTEPAVTPAFDKPAAVPRMSWIEQPTTGWVAGFAKDSAGKPLDGAQVKVKKSGLFSRTRTTLADGNGYFGFTNLKPGRYRVWAERRSGPAREKSGVEIEVTAGKVARAELQLR